MSDAPKPFLHRTNRQAITKEPDPGSRWSTQFPDMIGYTSQGGGKVPADYGWNTNPKQDQEEMTEETLKARFSELRVLPQAPAQPQAPALPADATKK